MKRILTLLVFLSLVVSACTQAATPTSTAEQAQGGLPTVAPTATTKPSGGGLTGPQPTTAPTGPVIEKIAPGNEVYIRQLRFFDFTRGWGVGNTGTGDDHVLITYDAGQSWTEFTPPEPASEGAAAEKGKRAHLFFTSIESGWVVFVPEGSMKLPSSIWYTTDGGKTWTASQGLDGTGLESAAVTFQNMVFSDPQNGWMMFSTDGGAGQAPAVIFNTTDGGQTWNRLVDPQSSSGSIGVCCRTGLLFLDPKVGLITSLTPPDPKPHVNWSTDGGKTWTQQDLPPADETVFASSLCSTESPTLVGGNTVVVLVECTQFVGMAEKRLPYLYFTTDQGATWQFLPMPASPFAEGQFDSIVRANKIVFADATTGWYFIEDTYTAKNTKEVSTKNQMYQTTDGGQTWTKINTSVWFGQYSFINPTTGWVAGMFNTSPTLLKTTDGGKTWLKLSPVVNP